MITGQFWKLHDDAALHRIDSAAIRLLTHSGCRIEHEGLLDMLERIDQYCKDAIRRYERPDIDGAVIAELRLIFLAAERRILGSIVTWL